MDIEFRAERLKDGGPVLNWIADRALMLADWLLVKFSDYAEIYVMEFDLGDLDDEDVGE